jgi:hypothetical protein
LRSQPALALYVRSDYTIVRIKCHRLWLNLFAPLDEEGRRKVLGHLGHLGHLGLRADPPESEYSDASDRLAEASQRSRHQTQIDVVLRGTGASGQRIVALIEAKFTEIGFGECGAYANPANPARDV